MTAGLTTVVVISLLAIVAFGIAIVVLPYWLALLVRGSTTLVRWRHD